MFVKCTDGHPGTYDKVMFIIVLSNWFNDEVVFVMVLKQLSYMSRTRHPRNFLLYLESYNFATTDT